MRLLIHCGLDGAGADEARVLARSWRAGETPPGVVVPETGFAAEDGHGAVARALSEDGGDGDLLADLIAELATSEAETAFLTSPSFAAVAPEALKTALADVSESLRAVFYVRRQDRLLAGRFAVRVAAGEPPADMRRYFLHGAESEELRYAKLLRDWRAALLARNLSVRVAEPESLSGGSVAADLARMLGGETAIAAVRRPSGESLALARRLGELLSHDSEFAPGLRATTAGAFLAGLRELDEALELAPFAPPPGLARRVMRGFERANQNFVERFSPETPPEYWTTDPDPAPMRQSVPARPVLAAAAEAARMILAEGDMASLAAFSRALAGFDYAPDGKTIALGPLIGEAAA